MINTGQFSFGDEEEIRRKRMEVLSYTYGKLQERFSGIRDNTKLVPQLAREVVEEYLALRRSLMARRLIPERIQRPKIAGLMTVAIMKVRPIQIVNFSASDASEISRDNEFLAAHNGIAIVAEGCTPDEMIAFCKSDNYREWWASFIRSIHSNPSDENCIAIFESIAHCWFPRSLDRGGE